jgi:hypothetical protein
MFKTLMTTTAAIAFADYHPDAVETVTIKGADGSPVRVNKDDYDADQKGDKTMTLHEGEAEEPTKDDEGETLPANLLVASEGTGNARRYFVTDDTGAKVASDKFASDGYQDDASAWAAIMAARA